MWNRDVRGEWNWTANGVNTFQRVGSEICLLRNADGQGKIGQTRNPRSSTASTCDGHRGFLPQMSCPIGGNRDRVAKRSRSFMVEIDGEQIGGYLGTASSPFDAGGRRHSCGSMVDDRATERQKEIQIDQ